ncbi:MAG: heme exporter protein CcmB [Planctomycetales bacterium]|nr:heme exporter protein CcmB [Planctomycetales bacterium]
MLATQVWWIIQKDIVHEFRAKQVVPRMILVGVMVAFLAGYQLDLSQQQRQQSAAGLCWLTLCLVAMFAVSQTVSAERESGCWDALRLYPISPQVVYISKMVVNTLLIGTLQAVLVPLFAIVCDTSWLGNPGALLGVLVLGNLGVASVGTLMGTLSSGLKHSQGLLVLLLLPMLVPVVVSAAEAMRLLAVGPLTVAGWRWIQLLATFAVVSTTIGWLMYDYVIEE